MAKITKAGRREIREIFVCATERSIHIHRQIDMYGDDDASCEIHVDGNVFIESPTGNQSAVFSPCEMHQEEFINRVKQIIW